MTYIVIDAGVVRRLINYQYGRAWLFTVFPYTYIIRDERPTLVSLYSTNKIPMMIYGRQVVKIYQMAMEFYKVDSIEIPLIFSVPAFLSLPNNVDELKKIDINIDCPIVMPVAFEGYTKKYFRDMAEILLKANNYQHVGIISRSFRSYKGEVRLYLRADSFCKRLSVKTSISGTEKIDNRLDGVKELHGVDISEVLNVEEKLRNGGGGQG